MFFDGGQIGHLAREDQVERAENDMVGMLLEQGRDDVPVAFVIEIVGQQPCGHLAMFEFRSFDQHRLEARQQILC